MRERILSYFHASPEEYSVIFTSGATGALHTVGEIFPWTKDSTLYYLAEVASCILFDRRTTTRFWASASTPTASAAASAC